MTGDGNVFVVVCDVFVDGVALTESEIVSLHVDFEEAKKSLPCHDRLRPYPDDWPFTSPRHRPNDYYVQAWFCETDEEGCQYSIYEMRVDQ